MDLNSIEEATRIFSSNYKFAEPQTSNHIDILTVMTNIVNSIDSVVCDYRKCTGITANEIHASKIDQLLHMNLFQDVLGVIKKIGHNPNIKIDALASLCHNIEEDLQQAVLVELLQAWKIKMGTYLKIEHMDIRSKWKANLFDVCRGGNTITKSDVKKGLFFTTDITAYSVDRNVSFSFFYNNVIESSLTVYDVPQEMDGAKPNEIVPTTWDAIADDYVFQPAEDGHDATESIQINNVGVDGKNDCRSNLSTPQKKSKTVSSSTTPKKLSPIFDDQSSQKKRKNDSTDKNAEGRKKGKSDKKVFDVPDVVQTIYNNVINSGVKKIPVDRDMNMIRQAWKSTIESLNTPDDLKKIWELHQNFLFKQLD